MNSAIKPWTYLAIGVCTSIAGFVLLVAAAAVASPVGLAVGGVIGGSFAFGLMASCIKEAAARRSLRHGDDGRTARAKIGGPTPAVARTRLADAMTNETEVTGARAFAPVASLVEAQLRRQTALRGHAKQRATLTRA